mgnify:FL=1
MLILTRKPGEYIAIGTELRVWLIEKEGREARIGIDAPLKIPVHRGEVAERLGLVKPPDCPWAMSTHPLELHDRLMSLSRAIGRILAEHADQIDFPAEAEALKRRVDAFLGRK